MPADTLHLAPSRLPCNHDHTHADIWEPHLKSIAATTPPSPLRPATTVTIATINNNQHTHTQKKETNTKCITTTKNQKYSRRIIKSTTPPGTLPPQTHAKSLYQWEMGLYVSHYLSYAPLFRRRLYLRYMGPLSTYSSLRRCLFSLAMETQPLHSFDFHSFTFQLFLLLVYLS